MKPVLVFYINVGNIASYEVLSYIDLVKNSVSHIKGYEMIFIPVRKRDSEVQCLNSIALSSGDENKKEVKHSIKSLLYNANKMLESIPYISKSVLMVEKKEFKLIK